MDAQPGTKDVEETVSLPSEAAPAAATGGDAPTSSRSAAPASQEQSSAEAPTTAAGPSSAVEQDPAPIQPPIQPVSNLDIVLDAFEICIAVLCIDLHINTTSKFHPLLKLPAGKRLR